MHPNVCLVRPYALSLHRGSTELASATERWNQLGTAWSPDDRRGRVWHDSLWSALGSGLGRSSAASAPWRL